jgi:hypothetical protein
MYNRSTLWAVAALAPTATVLVACGAGSCPEEGTVVVSGRKPAHAKSISGGRVDVYPGLWPVIWAGNLSQSGGPVLNGRPAVQIKAKVKYEDSGIVGISKPSFWADDLPGRCVAHP